MNRTAVTSPIAPLAREASLADMRALDGKAREPCAHCGQTARLSPHRLDRSKVSVLETFADMFVRGCSWSRVTRGSRTVIGELPEGVIVTKATQYLADQHAMRLTWFRLLEHKAARSGRYRLTKAGWDFLHGISGVSTKILCRAGAVVFYSREQISIGGVRGLSLERAYWHAHEWREWRDLASK